MASQLIVVVGSINADLVVCTDRRPVRGETVLGRSFSVSPGGKGANQAVAAQRLGASVAMIGAVGDDEYTAAALGGLKAAGVDITRVAVGGFAQGSDTRTGVALVTVGADGDNSIIVVAGANATVDATVVDEHADLLRRAAAVVLQGEIPRDGIEEAARLTPGRLILNLAPAIPVDAAVVRQADPLIVNEIEGATALGLLYPDQPDAPDGPDAVTALLEAGVPTVILTRGRSGAIVGERTGDGGFRLTDVPAHPVRTVDTTGAGDAFVGAVAHALVQGQSLVEAARFATRVSAYVVQYPGAQPSYPDANSLLPGGDATGEPYLESTRLDLATRGST